MDQIDRNTVSADNQLGNFEPVFFENETGTGMRILFVGNSITLHTYKPDIGWYGENYGMAASKKENDYVHLVMKEVLKRNSDAACAICQASQWELNYKNGHVAYNLYKSIRDFKADIIVMRIVDNCPRIDFDKNKFKEEYKSFINFLNLDGNAEVILTTGFWRHTADEAIMEVGKEKGYKAIYLGELGEDDEMKAIGLFEHSGVANHPGDKGMKKIADMILEQINFERIGKKRGIVE